MTFTYEDLAPGVRLYCGNALDVLATMDAGSVHCCITSPPYWGLRKYDGEQEQVWGGVEGCEHEWGTELVTHQRGQVGGNSTLEGGLQAGGDCRLQEARQGQFCLRCGAWRGALGLEPTPELYIDHLVSIFREVKRVLRDDGTCWVVIGDSYASGNGTCHNPGGGPMSYIQKKERYPLYRGSVVALRQCGLKPKDLCGIPWRFAFAMQADGWWLRSDIIWAKPNPMPESVTDRPTRSHEYVFMFAKSGTYYYDAEAVKEQSTTNDPRRPYTSKGAWQLDGRPDEQKHGGEERDHLDGKRNRRSVWFIATHPYAGAHFATYPPALVEPCIKAGSSEKGVCPKCGAPWVRMIETARTFESGSGKSGKAPVGKNGPGLQGGGETGDVRRGPCIHSTTLGWRPSCGCGGDPVPATVLDPFCGSGTTGAVAVKLGRAFIGIDLSEKYIKELAEPRISDALLQGRLL